MAKTHRCRSKAACRCGYHNRYTSWFLPRGSYLCHMPYNETLAHRIREALMDQPQVEEKVMFGGLCFMVNDKMCIGIVKDDLMCRIAPEALEEALEKNGCRMMDFSGKPMKSFVFVDESGMRTKAEFMYWVNLCLEYNPQAKASPKKKK